MSAALSVLRFETAAADTYPRGLPAWTYAHPAMTRLEHQRVLLPSWQIVCHVNDIPRAGDTSVFDLGPDSVMVLRDREGAIRAFHNVCRHRAARLMEQGARCSGAITCPYHGWTYNLDGSLRGLPVRESFPALDRAAHGLLPVRMEIMAGFVFVCLAGDPPPPAAMWGGNARRFCAVRI